MRMIPLFFIILIIVINIFLFVLTGYKNQNHVINNYSNFRAYTSTVTGYVFDNHQSINSVEVRNKLLLLIHENSLDLIVTDIYGTVLFNSINQRSKLILKEDLFYDNSYKSENASFKISDLLMIDGKVEYFLLYIIPEKTASGMFDEPGKYSMLIPVVATSFLFIILCLYLYVWYDKNYLKPLQEFGESVRRITKGDWNYELPEHSFGEMQSCIQSFNMMREEMKQSLKLRNEYETSRRELTAYISHDLKTPLSIIRGYTESILDGVPDKEKIEEYHRGIYKTVLRMEKLIQDLFVHSQMELNNLSINKKEQYMDSTLLEILDSEEHYIELNKRKIILNQPFSRVLVNIDKNRIEQVLVNIISNAIKYSDDGDTISISTNADSEAVYISISDTGRGIGKEELPFIFEKFYRGDRARNSKNSGAGLGLAICKYNIEAHGGAIQVKSKKGEGTTFILSLPLA
jgi:signal transduction histidine kinase